MSSKNLKIKNNLLFNISCAMILTMVCFAVINVLTATNTFSNITEERWDGTTIATSFKAGNGTKENPFQISNGEELAYFKQLIESLDSQQYNDKYYILTNNIDLGDNNWKSIGNNLNINNTLNIFKGYFNGNGYTIKNYKMTEATNINNELYYGLFSITENAEIKNLNINNVNITPSITNETLIIGVLSGKSYNYEILDENTASNNNKIANISIGNASLNLTSTTENINSKIGGIIGEISNEATLSAAFINLTIDSNYSLPCGKIVGNLSGDISNIVTKITVNNLLLENVKEYATKSEESKLENIYTADYTNNIFTLTKDNEKVNVENLIIEFNKELESDYKWSLNASNLLITKVENPLLQENSIPNKNKLFAFTKSMKITLHDSGIEGNTVYINDLESDYNHYLGKNYTDSDGTIPSLDNKNIYNDTNLVKVYIAYSGEDINNPSLVGNVSLSEQQNTYIYYKYYVIENGYINIELIDNPFTDRPNDKAFNGWVTDYFGTTISYDYDYYVRHAKVPVTYSNGKPNDISITFYASWTEATTYQLTGNSTAAWNSAFSELNAAGMQQIGGRIPIYEDISNFYIEGEISRFTSYPSGAVNSSGNNVTGMCWSSSCTYYIINGNAEYDEDKTYYQLRNGIMSVVTPSIIGYEEIEGLANNTVAAGFYKEVLVPRNSSLAGYYDELGRYQTGGTCTIADGCKYYELIQYYDNNGNVNVVDNSKNSYFYLVTRDTNIVVLRANVSTMWGSSHNKPFTLTGINNGSDYRNSYYLNISNTYINAYADTKIENIKVYTRTAQTNSEVTPPGSSGSRNIFGRWNNLKIGRGITKNGNYINFNSVVGGYNSSTGSSAAPTKYRLIVESGLYNSMALSTGSSGGTDYINAQGIYGSDYDRVLGNNDNLEVRHCASGSWAGTIRGKDSTDIALDLIVKSGGFGTNGYDYATGIYVGGRNSGTHYSPRRITVEGGYIYNLIGGPLTASSQADYNDTYMYIKGGNIDMVIGGAGRTETYGNRIIQVTSGTINYSVFGGSNGIEGSNQSSYLGTLNGTPYVYIGGNAIIGNSNYVDNNQTESGSEAGSVFGIGNGRNGYSGIGSCDNSNIIITGDALVRRNVYGGGNYGATGYSSSANTNKTNILIKGGNINGSVYGGGNNNGAGTSSKISTIDIKMTGGTVKGSVYGGSRTTGTVYGTANIDISAGNIEENIYGGGEGNNTYVSRNVSVTIGSNDLTTEPTINNSVYGGSAYGTVNNTTKNTNVSSYTTKVTVNKGLINGSVFGGGRGNNSYTPYVAGNVTVYINGGNIGQVFGGNDAAGSTNGTNYVYLNSGTIGNAFGGGNNTGQNTTNIFLQGANLNYLFGGSNSSGTVSTANVTVTSGKVASIYGGNNVGGTTTTANVTIDGGTITNDVYGGGKLANTTTSNVKTNALTLNNVYGGGESANVNNTNIEVNNTSINNVFGGSNITGTVNKSVINIYNGIITNIYGGNNQGGSTSNTNILVNDGTITSIYGGGNKASSITSNLDIYDGKITNVYGGGNEAGLTTSNVNIYGGTITNTYGGSNESGNIDTSNIKTNNNTAVSNGVSISVNVVAENATWQSSTYKTYATINVTVTNKTDKTINDWTAYVDIPNSELYNNWSGTNVSVNGSKYEFTSENKWSVQTPNYLKPNGGSHSFTFYVLSNQDRNSFKTTSKVTSPIIPNYNTKITNIYGGNNKGGKTSTTNIDISTGQITNIFGGGNEAVVDGTNLNITGGLIGTIYGGGNEASVNNNTKVVLKDATINNNIYGGGNEGTVNGNTDVSISSLIINGSAYAGGNGNTAVVRGNTTITLDGTTVIGTTASKAPSSGCVFGGGNAAPTGEAANNNSIATVNIVGGTIYGNVYGGANTSVVYGETFTNIGTNAVNISNLKEENIDIAGTVFGGGEANASGSDVYDYSFISVTGAIDININGDGYANNSHKFEISGSIFGSGNASSSSGTSNIYISNLGSRAAPSKNISIQRAERVIIDNSWIELVGTTDRTNEYSSIKYSFNRIDSLTIKNNSSLLLQQNANLLKEFNSMVDINGKEEKATVTIDEDTKTVTRNVDNRVYLIPNKNLNITTNEAATAYGKVSGMTFFGMYNSYANGSFSYGVYDSSFNYGDSADAGDAIIGGSYVLGLHNINHDITKDGFYSNYLNDSYTEVTTAYIEPTPPDSNYYMWTIGIQAINYSFSLTASKYSSLGTYELSMRDFAKGDTIFNVIGFNADGLTSGVSLIDSTSVPKLADTDEEANSLLGLSMKSETQEWTSYETTKLLSAGGGTYTGDTTYKTDSQALAPSMMFYLYHAKNISLEADLGTVIVSLQAMTPINEIEYQLDLITITIDINARNYTDGAAYDASITYDKKYEMPAATLVNITNKSQFTAYYSMYTEAESFEKHYGKGNSNYHVLTSSYALPVGTTITMLDYSINEINPEYYYYTVDETSYNLAIEQLEKENEVSYRLSDFIKMGSISTNNTYNDKLANELYYDNDKNRVVEEFLFIVDLKDTNTVGNSLNNSLLFELRNNEDYPLITVLGIRHPLMIYNLYESSNVVLNQTVNLTSGYLYPQVVNTIDYSTNISYDQTGNRESIINTNYESSNMGLNVAIYDNSNNLISSSLLTGTSIKMDGVTYYADSDGIFRIKLSGKVSNLNKKLYLETDTNLPAGLYNMKFTLFASSDGLHNSYNLGYSELDKEITVVGSNNAILVTTDDKNKLVDGQTGLNYNELDYNRYNLTYNSVLANPNIRISVLKRNTITKDDTTYQEIDFNNIFKNSLINPTEVLLQPQSANEKMITARANSETSLKFDLNSNITSGTYKLVFKLYDHNQLIEEEVKYIIVKKNVN